MDEAAGNEGAHGRVLLVTGASRGIGAATARLAARRGYVVALNYRSDAGAAQDVLGHILAAGGQAIALQADVSEPDQVAGLFEQIDSRLGRLDGLVNNAGVLETQMRLEQLDPARVRRIFATNLLGPLLCCQQAVRRMSTRHGGRGGAIVNVSSVAALTGSPGEYVDYAASKAALDTLTRGLAQEVALEGIRVNGVRPGFIHTQMHAAGGEPDRVERVKSGVPLRRGGQPDEVAQAILWLLSDQASYSTGNFLDVAGGR
jgi:NAD(P)-dependent dehydrogenase (short-subunit alcohol dehydrogenase family)